MRKALLPAALALFSVPAMAEDVSVRTFCQMVPYHVADASVDYVPGRDVRGRPVVPADINKVVKDDFDAVDIPVEYNVLGSLGVALPPGSQARPLAAMVRIYKDGRVQYNGNDLTPQAQVLCANRSGGAAVPVPGQGQYYNPDMEPKTLGQLKYTASPATP